MGWDQAIVALLVIGAAIYVARIAYRMFAGKSTGGCGCGHECPASKQGPEATDH